MNEVAAWVMFWCSLRRDWIAWLGVFPFRHILYLWIVLLLRRGCGRCAGKLRCCLLQGPKRSIIWLRLCVESRQIEEFPPRLGPEAKSNNFFLPRPNMSWF